MSEEEEPLDPRVQHELEKLNKASLLINKLENDLDDARGKFRSLLSDSTHQLESLAKKLGSCIDRAKPYYDARIRAKEVQKQTYEAATKYERAMGMQTAAREMVDLAEQGYQNKQRHSFDTAWQEMLNHATTKVMDAEQERMLRENEHKKTAALYAEVQEEVSRQYKEQKRSIAKSKPYYEKKAALHENLDNQKNTIERYQADVNSAKKLYAKALSNLEQISEEIHAQRQNAARTKELGERGAGVGSESPTPAPYEPPKPPSRVVDGGYETTNKNPEATDSKIKDEKTETIGFTIGDDSNTENNNIKIESPVAEPESPSVCVTDTEGHECLKVSASAPPSLDHRPIDESFSPILRSKKTRTGSFQLSAKRLLEDAMSLDSDSGSVLSLTMLDDNTVTTAMSEEFFNGSYEEELRRSTHEDLTVLPATLSEYQRSYESARKSLNHMETADLKLDEVLKLLEEADDESIV